MTRWKIVEDYDALSHLAASILLESVERNPSVRLGLPTGQTPLGMYREVARICRARPHCFSEVITFNLDEYVGIPRDHPGSYFSYMKKHVFDHVDIRDDHTHVPCGDPERLGQLYDVPVEEALIEECRRYESLIDDHGGIDLMFLGLGSNGHIAFNEPGTSFESTTHVVDLEPSTIAANARFFPGREVPRRAITMGIATILSSRQIVLLASGDKKGTAIDAIRAGAITEDVPVSALHKHPNVIIICDREASGDR